MKKQTHSLKKPKSIVSLEKAYNIQLVETEFSQDEFDDISLMSSTSYSIDKNGVVNGLNLSSCAIADLSPIVGFNKLLYLDLTNNLVADLSSFLSSMTQQTELRHLFLGGNKINDIKPIINAPNLMVLTLWGNPLPDLSPLKALSSLTNLYCQSVGLSDISFITSLTQLNDISATNNLIENIDALSNAEKLQEADFTNNNITNIDILSTCKPLKNVYLSNNKIKYISKDVAKKFNWLKYSIDHHAFSNEKQIKILDNPLQFPPTSVIELGEVTVKNYYSTSEKFGHAPLSEGRIIIIGDGSAGKSSLIERLLYDRFEQGKSQTNGIKIENWHLNHLDGRPLLFHIWDFGGQEIQHAVHKFFFTEGCLYILVLDNRKEEEPEYWLQQIESLGRGAPVVVVFNKQDDNIAEIADRKFLKEKYPNIVGFYNTSCKTGFGIQPLKADLEKQVIELRTVEEQFPNNWFKIKQLIEENTSGSKHYLDYEVYSNFCKENNAEDEDVQKLLLKYFTTIGAITWFGDTYLNFLHVLSPAWITQGVYKIITSQKTAKAYGQINIADFKKMLQPVEETDYTYEEKHYGYLLSMMKKFDLCYTPDDINLLIPSAFGKEPKVEYSEFRGSNVRTYILQFKDYMPLALIHRFVAKRLADVYENNFWYSGIVIQDTKSNSLAMVQADKEAKRIYVRIKGEAQLGMWEYVRREFHIISSSYANINYYESVALDEKSESTVNYEDLISHVQAKKSVYFHAKLKQDFNVGYLIGLFQTKEQTIDKIKNGEIILNEHEQSKKVNQIVLNIINNNSPHLTNNINTQITIDIDIEVVSKLSSSLIGDANYLIDELKKTNKALTETLQKVVQFANDAKIAQNSGEIKERGWGRRLKSILKTLSENGESIKKIKEGGDAIESLFHGIKGLASHLNLNDVVEFFKTFST